MYQERKEDLSVYYFINNLFEDVSEFVTIVDGYPETTLQIPTIAVESKRINTEKFELGNTKRLKIRAWVIDVFARNKSQRDEFSYRILNSLEDTIPVYNYDEGFPPNVNPSQLGCLIEDNIRLDIVRVMPQLVDKLYYRATITFTASYNQF